jgi:hypothetical protein
MFNGKLLLISTGITVLVCGAVVYFCNLRLQQMEAAILKQNQVLASFFATVQTDIRMGQRDLATPEALAAAQRYAQQKLVEEAEQQQQEDVQTAKFSKIPVSDDDDDVSSSEDDDDDDSDSVSDDEDEEEDEDDDEVEDVTIITLTDNDKGFVEVDVQVQDVPIEDVQVQDVPFEDVPFEDVQVQVLDETKIDDILTRIKLEDIKVEKVDTKVSVPPPKYDAFKVDDLRKVVQDKQLASKDDIRKMKKGELLALLANQK